MALTYYDAISEGYTELHQREQLQKIAVIQQHFIFKKSMRVLDVGCGPGFFAHKVAAKVVGIDPSFELLKKAHMHSHVVCGRAEFLPFKNKTFDVVVSITAVHHCHAEKALAEMKRVGTAEWIVTVLKKAAKRVAIGKQIQQHFVCTKIEEEKDDVYFCQNKEKRVL